MAFTVYLTGPDQICRMVQIEAADPKQAREIAQMRGRVMFGCRGFSFSLRAQ
jgi:hypothetical protein